MRLLLVVFLFLISSTSEMALAAKVSGRLAAGVYSATERFSDASSGSTSNDFLTASSRIFLRVSEISDNQYEFISDLRDKHDFFDKLNREKLQLDASNTFQVRQMSLRYPNVSGGLYGTVGRFPVLEAGALHTDGAEVGYHLSRDWNWASFGGLNPKRPEQTYVVGNLDSKVYGSYLSFQPRGTNWSEAFWLNHAFVSESVGSEVDRNYFYHSGLYQWNPRSRVISLAYLDFVPRTNLQTGNLIWQQGWSRPLSSSMSVLTIDVIEYSRRRNVRERLESSVYREGELRFRGDLRSNFFLEGIGVYGVRQFDNLKKVDSSLKSGLSRICDGRCDIYLQLGRRDNFASQDLYGKMGLGYFSNKVELTLDEELASETYADGKSLHPVVSEMSFSVFMAKDLYGTLSVQNALDEQVTIWSGFCKVGYRFGTQEVPPIRDGAPPRGRL